MGAPQKPVRSADEIARLAGIDSLLEATRQFVTSQKDAPKPDLATKDDALRIIDSGYTNLPDRYRTAFLDPLRTIVQTYDYQSVSRQLPLLDWMEAIQQREVPALQQSCEAFEEVISTLYDGFLAHRRRAHIRPPDTERVPPLVKFGNPMAGPYTIPADEQIAKLGIRTAVVSLPPGFSNNLALWATLGHECGGHDVLGAYDGLLNELAQNVGRAVLDAGLTGSVDYNDRSIPMGEFASKYWARCINEAASDVCGMLNLGAAHIAALVVVLVPLRGGKIASKTTLDDPHPIDLARVWLAAEVMGSLPHLAKARCDAWVKTIDRIEKEFGEGDELALTTATRSPRVAVTIPAAEFRKSVAVAAQAIAFERLKTLDDHALSDVLSWSDADEALADGVAQDFIDGKAVEIQATDDASTFSNHVLSGAVFAMCEEGADIAGIHGAAIETLTDLYKNSPVWAGFPAGVREHHRFMSSYRVGR